MRALVDKAQQGDRGAFEELVSAHAQRLKALIHARMAAHLKRVYDVDDVAQEVLVQGLGSMHRFRWEDEDSFMRWLGGIAEHFIIKLSSRYEREQKLSVRRDPPGTDISPSRGLRREERFQRLQRAVSELSRDHREVILLARVEGLPMKEIARRMQRSPAAARQLLWRALETLRTTFGSTESLHLPARTLIDEEARDDG